MYGSTEEEKVRIDLAVNQIVDWRTKFTKMCYSSAFENVKPGYLKEAKSILQQFSDFLGDRKYVAGDKISFVDFMLFEYLDQHKIFDASLLEPHDNLKEFAKRIEELPAIAAYRKSDKFKARPINNKMAGFK